jgi:hypothetical protein
VQDLINPETDAERIGEIRSWLAQDQAHRAYWFICRLENPDLKAAQEKELKRRGVHTANDLRAYCARGPLELDRVARKMTWEGGGMPYRRGVFKMMQQVGPVGIKGTFKDLWCPAVGMEDFRSIYIDMGDFRSIYGATQLKWLMYILDKLSEEIATRLGSVYGLMFQELVEKLKTPEGIPSDRLYELLREHHTSNYSTHVGDGKQRAIFFTGLRVLELFVVTDWRTANVGSYSSYLYTLTGEASRSLRQSWVVHCLKETWIAPELPLERTYEAIWNRG